MEGLSDLDIDNVTDDLSDLDIDNVTDDLSDLDIDDVDTSINVQPDKPATPVPDASKSGVERREKEEQTLPATKSQSGNATVIHEGDFSYRELNLAAVSLRYNVMNQENNIKGWLCLDRVDQDKDYLWIDTGKGKIRSHRKDVVILGVSEYSE